MNSPPSPFIWSTSICEETMPDPRPTEFRGVLRELLLLGALRVLGGDLRRDLGVGAQKLHGLVQQRHVRLRHRGALGAGERGDAVVVKPRRERAKTERMDHRLSISHVPFIGSHARFSATLTLSFRRRFVSASFSSSSDGV